jgi:signal transduction histidine kinase
MERVCVKELIDELVDAYNTFQPRGVELITDVQVDDKRTVRSNRQILNKVIGELLLNAKKFTTQGYVKLSVKAEGLKVLFIVEDTGPGISESLRATLFSTFEKGNIFSDGLGLGLPVCRQYVRLIGGELKYDQTYTDGSRFIIVIPDSDAYVELHSDLR